MVWKALCWLLAFLFRSCVAVTAAGALPPLVDSIPFVLCVAVWALAVPTSVYHSIQFNCVAQLVHPSLPPICHPVLLLSFHVVHGHSLSSDPRRSPLSSSVPHPAGLAGVVSASTLASSSGSSPPPLSAPSLSSLSSPGSSTSGSGSSSGSGAWVSSSWGLSSSASFSSSESSSGSCPGSLLRSSWVMADCAWLSPRLSSPVADGGSTPLLLPSAGAPVIGGRGLEAVPLGEGGRDGRSCACRCW